MIKNSRFLGRFNKFTSQRCNTQMLRSSHKKISLSLTIISCVVVTAQLLYLYMRETNYLQALVAPECCEALEESEVLTLNDIGYYENTFASFRE